MLTAILTISGLTLQAQEQDFSTKQAAPKAKVFNFKGGQTANPVSSVKPIEKVRKPGIAFRDARTATSMSLDGKSPVKAPVQPQDGRKAKRPSHMSVDLPMKAPRPMARWWMRMALSSAPPRVSARCMNVVACATTTKTNW